jgi:aryl-alcohol dehydrogenase-like predicted oxidoreductase
MEFRHLGHSGLKISEITFGNWITHGSQVDDDRAIKTIHAALDSGITTFDTADVYANTKAEVVMGDALRGQRREGLEIFTKVYWPTGPGVNDRGLSRKHIIEACHGSLKRLGTDYIDLYQAHRYDYETPLEETLRAFDDLVRQGKILYVGVSEWTASEIREAIRVANEMGFDRIISNQPQYNMLYRVIEAEVIPASEENGIGQIVWSPIAQGVLTGKYKPGQPVPADSRATDANGGADMVSHWLKDETLRAVAKLEPIAADMNLTLAQMSIAWVLSNPNVSAAIIGASRPEQVTDNVKAAGITLPADVLSAIDYTLGDLVITDPSLTASPKPRP